MQSERLIAFLLIELTCPVYVFFLCTYVKVEVALSHTLFDKLNVLLKTEIELESKLIVHICQQQFCYCLNVSLILELINSCIFFYIMCSS